MCVVKKDGAIVSFSFLIFPFFPTFNLSKEEGLSSTDFFPFLRIQAPDTRSVSSLFPPPRMGFEHPSESSSAGRFGFPFLFPPGLPPLAPAKKGARRGQLPPLHLAVEKRQTKADGLFLPFFPPPPLSPLYGAFRPGRVRLVHAFLSPPSFRKARELSFLFLLPHSSTASSRFGKSAFMPFLPSPPMMNGEGPSLPLPLLS